MPPRAARAGADEPGIGTVSHIAKLPDAAQALEMLHELKRHAEPILKARGWRVHKLCAADLVPGTLV